MNENKRREWVKNAIIIFLIVMLLLTFFSNTIMNYSLPEVSARYVESGTLSEQIRGSGEVKANQTYEVKMGETRKIASVEVQAGDTVEKGQVLYKLEDSESDELTTAEKNLKTAKKAYDEALLSVGFDYRTDELDIANQEEDLERLKAELPKISRYASDYEKAKSKVKDIEAEIKELEKDSKEYNDILTAISEEDYAALGAENYAKITKAQEELDAAEKAKAETEKKISEYESDIASGGDQGEINSLKKSIDEKKLQISKAENDIIYEYTKEEPSEDTINSLNDNISQYKLDLKYLEQDYSEALSKSSKYSVNKQLLTSTKNTLARDEKKYDTAKKTLDDLIASIKQDAKTKSSDIQDKIDEANERLEQAKTDRDEAGEKASLTTEAQEEKIRDAETALEKAKIALSQKKSDDAVTAGKAALHLQELQEAVNDADAEVQKLKKNSIGAEVTAPVGGKIAALSFSAGEEAAKDAVAASIEMSEKGYTLEITASVEQSKKVRVGDEAEVQYFWYGEAHAKLTSITPDPSNPSRNRILTFSVTGDITPGQNLQISMGSKGQRYEYIVPNSAVREDNNGKFILAVRSKSSPLGNRYMAERIDVEVLASDDTSSAISGDIFGGDYIITTATAPISAGDQVRLVDN